MKALDVWRGEGPRSLLSSWDSFSKDFERMFDEMEQTMLPMRSRMRGRAGRFLPACDIEETDSAYLLEMDLPGLKSEDISIEVVGQELRVSGEKVTEHEEKGVGRYRTERECGKFYRSFTLPENANPDDIEASYDNGVLELSIPKTETREAKRVQVKSGSGGIVKRFLKSEEKKKAGNE